MNLTKFQEEVINPKDNLEAHNWRSGGYYLRKWHRYQENLNYLNERGIRDAKILFSALSELPEEERAFLADKYCVPTKKKNGVGVRPKDSDLAQQYGMDTEEYRKQRRSLERKMSVLITKYKTEYK